MRLIWYNRDALSDEDMRQAKAVANRLLGKNTSPNPIPGFFTGTQMQTPIQYQNSQNFYSGVVRPSLIPWELQNGDKK